MSLMTDFQGSRSDADCHVGTSSSFGMNATGQSVGDVSPPCCRMDRNPVIGPEPVGRGTGDAAAEASTAPFHLPAVQEGDYSSTNRGRVGGPSEKCRMKRRPTFVSCHRGSDADHAADTREARRTAS